MKHRRSSWFSGSTWFYLCLGILLTGCWQQPDDNANSSNKSTHASLLADDSSEKDALALAKERLDRGDIQAAESKLRDYLVRNPTDANALFLSARCQAYQGDLAPAVRTLECISPDHPEAGIPAIGQAADWLVRLHDYNNAEVKLRKLVSLAPHLAIAHRRLALLLNSQGRRSEAIAP